MADERRRGKPYVWVTHITGLLAGTDRCYWRAWFKAHHKPYDKLEDPNFDIDAWTADHDRLVGERARELRAQGFVVGVEEDNSFTLRGDVALLGAKPDLLIVRENIRVRDVKTGKERESDAWQVRVYQYGIARVVPSMKGKRIDGEIEYRGGRIVKVDPPTPPQIARLGETMKEVGGDTEPPRVPSRFECQRCDIANCPDRDKTERFEGETKDF